MSQLSKINLFLLFLYCLHPCFGQGKKCRESDSSLCYIKEKFPVSTFGIEKKYECKDTIDVTLTPLLADVDGDCIPELIYPGINSNNILNGNNILIFDTKTGSLKFSISTYALYPFSNTICIADINDDGIPEIFALASPYSQNPGNIQGRLICYNIKGDMIWISDERVDFNNNRIFGIPGLADFNQDGIPEIYISNKIFNAQTGVKLADGGNNGIGTENLPIFHYDAISIAAQLDNDSTDLELAAGYTIYKVNISNPNGMTGNSMNAMNILINNAYLDGATTVADINLDGILDVVVTNPGSGGVYAYTLSNGIPKLIAHANPPGIDFGIGSPFIGDIKGTGRPSILFTKVSKLYAYSYNGTNFLHKDWELNTMDSSGVTGLTIFDFDNNGKNEIVYRDEATLSIIDGSGMVPTTIAKIPCLSITRTENPIVGDIDHSGHAKICVPCAVKHDWPNGNLIVFGPPDSLPSWAPARGIWNQYNYHVLNINDDLTIPRVEKNNATYKNGKYNNFYVQESLLDENGMYNKPAASLWGKILAVNYNPSSDQYTVNFNLYNRIDASQSADSGMAVAFYNGNPETNGPLIGIYHSLKIIAAGDSLINLSYVFSAFSLTDLFMVINTKRDTNGLFESKDFILSECDYTDNFSQLIVLPKNKKTEPCHTLDSSLCYIKEKYPISKFAIEKKFECPDSISSTQTPLLADLDGDCIPEIIVTAVLDQKILIIDSKTGQLKWKINTPAINPLLNGLAVADVDNDGIPEIFFEAASYSPNPSNIFGKLFCYHADGKLYWISDQRVDLFSQFNDHFGGTPALADFNQDGIPEIYVNNKIFNAQTGIKLADGGNNGVGTGHASNFRIDALTIAAQLDEDSTDLELAAGFTIYKVKILNTNGIIGNSMTPINFQLDSDYKDGFTTVADINLDGRLDVVVTTPGFDNDAIVYAYTLSNGMPQLIAKAYPPGLGYIDIGPGFIGDIKGLGKPSILLTRFSKLIAYSYNGSSIFQQDWSFTTTDSSGTTGLTLFDFNNDGIPEIVYRDETKLRIIDGSAFQPKEIAKIDCYSWTWSEYPIVGDIDKSGHAKICIPCALKHDWPNGNLTVFGSPDSLPSWAPARDVWNQYSYHVLNIDDDLKVPRIEKNNATYKNGKYNNFFVQESLLDNGIYLKRGASLTGKIKCINYDPIKLEYTVIFDIYNLANASFGADSSLPVSFYNGDPATSGYLIGIYFTLRKIDKGDSLLNLIYKFSAANLTDLFMVINTTRDGSGQFNPTDFSIGECDYTDNIFHTLNLPKIEKINATMCKGGEFDFFGSMIQDSGVYYNIQKTANGCDSLINILTLNTVDTVHVVQYIRNCDQFIWNGKTYTQSGSFIYDTINQFGCDSITTLVLVINNSNAIDVPHTACDSFHWNGVTYNNSGNYLYQDLNVLGCDSITTLQLTINKSDKLQLNQTSCISYAWNGQTYNQSGNYQFDTINQFGCDSVVTLNLSINPVINTTITNTSCDTYLWNGQTYTQSGNYQYKTVNTFGCDSITTLQLIINKSSNSNTDKTACDSYVWNGQTYTQSGNYQYKSQNVLGCDSIAILQLTIIQSSNSNSIQVSCDNYTWNGQTYNQSGNYQYKTQSISGCDSIAILQLTINNSVVRQINQTACDTYNWNGQTFTQSGNYQYKATNVNGCDSIINLNLNINKSSHEDLALSVCDSLNFLGQTLKANGNYQFRIQNSNGCDSMINLNLTLRSEIQNNKATNCDTFKWNITGLTYNQSGVYFQKYTNSFGCDSIYKLNLSILKSVEKIEKAEACKEYFWPVNKIILKQSGEYTYLLKTFEGCDSIIKLNLILNQDFAKRDTVITDTEYTWPINNKKYPVSGTYQEDFISSDGCDSIHYLLLLINNDVGIYYPNIIHPGGLDRNSWFTLFDNGHTISSINLLTIYDRWGDMVWQKQGFAANDLQLGWDGTFQGQKVLPGVYVWHAQLALKDGSTITKKGDVTIVR